jgi:chaperonin GroES
VAKKKVAAKKSTNNKKPVKSAKPVKKTVKKAAKPSPKKIVKKAKPVKTAKPAVKAKSKKVMKAAPKAKASAKAKAVVKKAAKPAAKSAKATKTAKPVKKAAASKAAPKSLVSAALVRPSAPKKLVDLTNFVTPLDDRLMVQLTESERKTAGGLFIPDTVADMSGNLHGTVVAVGRGHFSKKGHLQPMDVKIGDKVVFAQHSGSKIKIQNEDLIILRESDVMGVVNK